MESRNAYELERAGGKHAVRMEGVYGLGGECVYVDVGGWGVWGGADRDYGQCGLLRTRLPRFAWWVQAGACPLSSSLVPSRAIRSLRCPIADSPTHAGDGRLEAENLLVQGGGRPSSVRKSARVRAAGGRRVHMGEMSGVRRPLAADTLTRKDMAATRHVSAAHLSERTPSG